MASSDGRAAGRFGLADRGFPVRAFCVRAMMFDKSHTSEGLNERIGTELRSSAALSDPDLLSQLS
jgi:hypothetical protein